jgi:hypothetical protein
MDELRGAAVGRHAAEQDLQMSKDRLQLAFDATGWWQYDPLRHVGSADARFNEIFDVTVDEISTEDLMTLVHPDDVERFWANRQAALGKGVDIADLLRAQLAHFTDLISSRIAVHGPKLNLKAAFAQAVGLALHELATNAGKYGALSTDTGRVDICWATDGDTFTMSWVERDGPPVSAPKRRGFGTLVMQTMRERSLTGKVELLYPPSGVVWRLTCPAANAPGPNGDS